MLKAIPEITLKLLEYYSEEKFVPSYGLRKEETFQCYLQRDLTTAHQSLTFSGLLEKRAVGRSDSSYRLTPAGKAARDARKQLA